MTLTGRQMRSRIDEDGLLTISLEKVDIPEPRDDELIVRVEASPINPSDLGLLFGPADTSLLEKVDAPGRPSLAIQIPPGRMGGVRGRLGQSMPVGHEGAGIVVAAGRHGAHLIGKRVGMVGGAMYADYRCIARDDVIPLPDGVSAADGASMFVNPLTALGFVHTARTGGHKAIVHTAAASNLGQMLQRLCAADGVPLVNVVRSQEQIDTLRSIGAEHVLNSQADDFRPALARAIAETGATVAFDAIGGGSLGSDILQAMERVAVGEMSHYSRYGSETFKQLYIYGALDVAPTFLNRMAFGFQWGVSAWLLFPFLERAGRDAVAGFHDRIARGLTTTFRSRYTQTIGLADALRPDLVRAYDRKATGEKFLIDPTQN